VHERKGGKGGRRDLRHHLLFIFAYLIKGKRKKREGEDFLRRVREREGEGRSKRLPIPLTLPHVLSPKKRERGGNLSKALWGGEKKRGSVFIFHQVFASQKKGKGKRGHQDRIRCGGERRESVIFFCTEKKALLLGGRREFSLLSHLFTKGKGKGRGGSHAHLFLGRKRGKMLYFYLGCFSEEKKKREGEGITGAR